MKTENKEKQKCNPVRQRAKQFERKLNTKEGEVREKKKQKKEKRKYILVTKQRKKIKQKKAKKNQPLKVERKPGSARKILSLCV